LFNDLGNRTALQAGNSREVRSRDGLPAADQVKDNSAVDVTGGLDGSDLRIGEIEATHLIAHPNYIFKPTIKEKRLSRKRS
jgi:hypothetical protein